MKPSQIEWCKSHLRLGDNHVFAGMHEGAERVRQHTQQGREMLEQYFANRQKTDARMVTFIGERRAELDKLSG